ncbi:protein of unknown function [Butyrivibrio hungatei DSM 14810]|uniref:DUF1836 domain-containing protein n=1 Tax=Butyrivibrio hungatei DSM 14810 TaxID=1121132 RepID=A0A1M7S4C8_9FIRM|nr:DUF1836 domain-containing protein [Butyrivibrio hungatei]SHN53301.1 protein of unknown function [Butyrivibrio hungatei DSM 14810]
MTIDNDDLMNSIIASLGRIDTIPLDEIPNIDLYMDQLTTFMDERLKKTTRYPETDKILTKTMINNYAKNDLLPPPVRKKYSKDHLILLIFIYYLKSILSINDIQTLIEPLKNRFHVSDDELNLSKIYETAFDLQKEELEPVIEDLKKKYKRAGETFTNLDITEDEKKRMQLFSFITLLSYDVYVKKLLIEKILDNVTKEEDEAKAKKDKSKEKKK